MDYVPALSNLTKSKVAYTQAKVNDHNIEVLLDSGASCSVIRKEYVNPKDMTPLYNIKLVNADGREITPLGTIIMKVNLGNLVTDQSFTVVENLSAPAILGCDFLTKVGMIIDFQRGMFKSCQFPMLQGQLNLLPTRACTVILDSEYPQAIPYPATTLEPEFDIPTDCHPLLESLLKKYSTIFHRALERTSAAEHIIDTGNSQPVKLSTTTSHPLSFCRLRAQTVTRDGQ